MLPHDGMLPWLRMSPVRIQRFLGETKRTIPWSRPASGRAPRVGLVQDAACGTGAQRRPVLDKTEHGATLVQVGPASTVAAKCHSEAMRGQFSVSPDRRTRSCCDDQLNPPNIPRSSSAAAVAMQACAHRWARSATPTITRCARVSSQRSNASCSIGVGSRHRPKRVMRRLRIHRGLLQWLVTTHISLCC